MTSHRRTTSELSRTPHSLSLKVLRLSKPQLSTHLSFLASSAHTPRLESRRKDEIRSKDTSDQLEDALSSALADSRSYSLGNAHGQDLNASEDEFSITPLLKLPASFGTAHVGETFACTLCINHEGRSQAAADAEAHNLTISNIRVSAVMKTPSASESVPTTDDGTAGVPLKLHTAALGQSDGTSPERNDSKPASLEPGGTVQNIVHFDLSEEGPHILAVTVTYTETQRDPAEEGAASSGRVRTFRKLYQFNAQQLLAVRTKAQAILPSHFDQAQDKNAKVLRQHALEAQVENLGNESVLLEDVELVPKSAFTSKSLDAWDLEALKKPYGQKPLLSPGDIIQYCFVLSPNTYGLPQDAEDSHAPERTQDGRVIIGHLVIRWRSGMGEPGHLSTGWLTAKKN
ncbi:MAG: hypothetical protein M1831_003313 [Alyxoria varia]|nr:MAG: hypothetical protein M1831_003313 [Alyxoria varia]